LLAAKGQVTLQAQSDALSVSAQKDLDIQSAEGKVTVNVGARWTVRQDDLCSLFQS